MSTTHVTTPRQARRKPADAMAPAPESVATPGLVAAMAQGAQRHPMDPEVKRLMIAEAAYYCAEKRGFAPGEELQDWLEAEAQVKAVLGE